MDRHESEEPAEGRSGWVRRMEQQRELDTIRFRRTEANQRALRGLRDLLNPMQLSRSWRLGVGRLSVPSYHERMSTAEQASTPQPSELPPTAT